MSEQVKIYIRNSKKYGKILNVPTKIQACQLYRLAASSHNLQPEDIHLILSGHHLPSDSTDIQLKDKAIVHIINLRQVNLEVIEVSIKPLYARSAPVKIQTQSQVTIRDFIDDKLFKAYGQKSDSLLLVHIGRQLNLDHTFREELIQNNSQLIVANIQQLKNRKSTESHKEIGSSEGVPVAIKDLEVPEEPKDIYPQPNFTIAVPQEVQAHMNINLIFDSKIRHTSSLQKCDLEPQEIIPEEVVPKISEEGREEEQGDREEVAQEALTEDAIPTVATPAVETIDLLDVQTQAAANKIQKVPPTTEIEEHVIQEVETVDNQNTVENGSPPGHKQFETNEPSQIVKYEVPATTEEQLIAVEAGGNKVAVVQDGENNLATAGGEKEGAVEQVSSEVRDPAHQDQL